MTGVFAPKEEDMKRVIAFLVLFMSITLVGNNARADTEDECRLEEGQGGSKTFPLWSQKGRKVVLLIVKRGVTVWLPKECGKWDQVDWLPTVDIPTGNSLQRTFDRESADSPDHVYDGYRIKFQTHAMADVGKKIQVEIKLPDNSYMVEVWIVADAAAAAALARQLVNQSEELLRRTEDVARKGGISGKRDLEIGLYGMISVESPGHEGYGIALKGNLVLGKFVKNIIQLGLSARLSWHYYEQRVLGLAANSDIMAQEYDLMAMFLFRIRPIKWVAIDVETGFGLRIFTHDDALTAQDGSTLLIRGVEGRVAYHPVWGLGVGVKFYPSRKLFVGVQWATTVSLQRQVQNPDSLGNYPSKGHLWNHFINIQVGFAVP